MKDPCPKMGNRSQENKKYFHMVFKPFLINEKTYHLLDGEHISIVKPFSYPKNYYYHKSIGYSVVAQKITRLQ
jgi:hypothetical protein